MGCCCSSICDCTIFLVVRRRRDDSTSFAWWMRRRERERDEERSERSKPTFLFSRQSHSHSTQSFLLEFNGFVRVLLSFLLLQLVEMAALLLLLLQQARSPRLPLCSCVALLNQLKSSLFPHNPLSCLYCVCYAKQLRLKLLHVFTKIRYAWTMVFFGKKRAMPTSRKVNAGRNVNIASFSFSLWQLSFVQFDHLKVDLSKLRCDELCNSKLRITGSGRFKKDVGKLVDKIITS